jgi:hypothetical protein
MTRNFREHNLVPHSRLCPFRGSIFQIPVLFLVKHLRCVTLSYTRAQHVRERTEIVRIGPNELGLRKLLLEVSS